jgi:hypothetical protein
LEQQVPAEIGKGRLDRLCGFWRYSYERQLRFEGRTLVVLVEEPMSPPASLGGARSVKLGVDVERDRRLRECFC